jgi:hypothetical protein
MRRLSRSVHVTGPLVMLKYQQLSFSVILGWKAAGLPTKTGG